MASTKRLKIAVFCDWYLPAYKAGGPVRSVANLVARLDHDFYVITSDRDWGDQQSYQGIQTNIWLSGKAGEHILYLTPDNQNPAFFRSILEEHQFDRIYLNSLFSPRFALNPLKAIRQMGWQSRTVLAPRGMLKSGAMAQKGLKKRVFLAFAKWLGWYRGITWHATTSTEQHEIEMQFPGVKIKIAPNLIEPISGQPHMTKACSDELVIITVARISPEKNTLGAIRFLQGIDPGTCRITWHLYGTHTDPDYYRQCQEAAAAIPIDVQFHGEIEHSAIRGVLEQGHVMYMPTLGENYGHSIVEAFVSGTPVLISDKTPWLDLESKKAGWDISLESAGFGKIIEQLVTMSPEEYSEFCHGAFNLGKQIANNPDHLEQNYRLFEHE